MAMPAVFARPIAVMLFAGCFSVSSALAPAATPEPDVNSKVMATQQQYVSAWTSGDVDALVELFTEDAVYWPASGGRIEGREEIRRHFESAPPPSAADISSAHTEEIGELVFDVGTVTVTLPPEAGGEFQGEYVVIAEQTGDGLRIRRLIGFPRRETPQPQ